MMMRSRWVVWNDYTAMTKIEKWCIKVSRSSNFWSGDFISKNLFSSYLLIICDLVLLPEQAELLNCAKWSRDRGSHLRIWESIVPSFACVLYLQYCTKLALEHNGSPTYLAPNSAACGLIPVQSWLSPGIPSRRDTPCGQLNCSLAAFSNRTQNTGLGFK
jgi:hypothetical protein